MEKSLTYDDLMELLTVEITNAHANTQQLSSVLNIYQHASAEDQARLQAELRKYFNATRELSKALEEVMTALGVSSMRQ